MGSTVFAVFVALLLASEGLAYDSVSQELDQWIIDNGGMSYTYIGTNKDGVRGLMVKGTMKAGTTAATIPGSTILNLGKIGTSSTFVTAALTFLREYLNPKSHYAPYIKSLPKPHEILGMCNFPLDLLHMLESEHWESMVKNCRSYLEHLLAGHFNKDLEWTIKEMLGTTNVTLEDLLYATAITETRVLATKHRMRAILAPVFDILNHKRLCEHTISEYDEHGHINIILGKDVEAGEELCYSYGRDMRDDHGVVVYGFLPEEEDPPRLLTVDHHQFDGGHSHHNLSEEPFTGTPAEVRAEMQRLQAILADLMARDEARPPPERSPRGEYVWDMMIALQQRRRGALRYELDRLEGVLASQQQHQEL